MIQTCNAHVEDFQQRARRERDGLARLRRRAAGGHNHKIGRLDVAMHQRLLNGMLQAQRRLPHEVTGQRDRKRAIVLDQGLQA